MGDFFQAFRARACRIPFLGFGLSVDVYSPNVLELSAALDEQQLSIGYLEIFQAHSQALRTVRGNLRTIPMAYHAEGLWFTQPDWEESEPAAIRLESVARDLELLDSWWVNQECASKEVVGYSFGTYVPPLFTEESARLTARQVSQAQEALDSRKWAKPNAPLILLEVPPLTYFGVGDLSYADYFQKVAQWAPCGFVLDLGHVWTAYRYSGAWTTQTFEEYFDSFLEAFPLERVIQIHVAGLACHPGLTVEQSQELGGGLPPWLDSHGDPIPEELFFVLGKVLASDRLAYLKGLALEVDNKTISQICWELRRVQEQFVSDLQRICEQQSCTPESRIEATSPPAEIEEGRAMSTRRSDLNSQYVEYVSLLSGRKSGKISEGLAISREARVGMQLYTSRYLSHEILCWGGDISDMFPRSCEVLIREGIGLEQFVKFWFARPWAVQAMEYDFFLTKIHRFLEFIEGVLPRWGPLANQEAMVLREGYVRSCREVGFSEGVV